MVHAAVGYAKATRRRATLACTSSIGPGATNMVTGAAEATISRLPVLLFPGDTYATRYQGPVLQQLEHPLAGDISVNDCFRPVARFFDRIVRPEQVLTALPEAMRVLTSPVEAGAVVLALPQDVQSHAYDFPERLFEERTWRIERPPADARRIGEAAELLRSAQRPLLISGGGARYSEAVVGLQRELGLPVPPHRMVCFDISNFGGDQAVGHGAHAPPAPPGGLGLGGDADRAGHMGAVAVAGLHQPMIVAGWEVEDLLAPSRLHDLKDVAHDQRAAGQGAQVHGLEVSEQAVVALDHEYRLAGGDAVALA